MLARDVLEVGSVGCIAELCTVGGPPVGDAKCTGGAGIAAGELAGRSDMLAGVGAIGAVGRVSLCAAAVGCMVVIAVDPLVA